MPGKLPFGRHAVPTKHVIPSPETSKWFWHPNRASVRFGPAHFRKELKALNKDLEITWHPLDEEWLIWNRSPRFQHKLCQGWTLLFPVAPWNLDNRVFALLYSRWMASFGGAKGYFDRIEAEMARDKERADTVRADSVREGAGDYYDSTQISVSMFGKSNGSKFANHHAGG